MQRTRRGASAVQLQLGFLGQRGKPLSVQLGGGVVGTAECFEIQKVLRQPSVIAGKAGGRPPPFPGVADRARR